MAIVLGPTRYGKSEVRIVRVNRDVDRHEIRDLNVSTSLLGEFADAYLTGDQRAVLPTDSQKNTVYAFAKERGVGEIEEFALALARHFVDDVLPVRAATVGIDEYAWERIDVGGQPHEHSFVRRGQEVRTTEVSVAGGGDDRRTGVVSGLHDLVVLKSTGSEFHGFLRDPYTTLEETTDRVMATSVTARWRYAGTEVAWREAYAGIRAVLLERFACVHSLALQQTLWEMGKAVLERYPEVAEISLSAPNKHHFVVDLSPFGLDNSNEVFRADDRPYGLIEATVVRDDALDLLTFNALADEQAERALLGCCRSRTWARAVLAGRPYPAAEAVLDAADRALAGLGEPDIDEALAGHPRIGERTADGASWREQAGVGDDPDLVRDLAEANYAYERRFGHVYLVSASGRSGAELLSLLHERLRNDPATERAVVRVELGKINRIRLERMLAG